MRSEKSASGRDKPVWRVVVVCEDSQSRKAAVSFCDELMHRFWPSREFEIRWFSFSEVGTGVADKSAIAAAAADMIVFAISEKLPIEVELWTESWAGGRRDREGKLAYLGPLEARAEALLRNLAHRSGLDFLTDIPASLELPESQENYADRACYTTSLLQDILRQKGAPPRPPGLPRQKTM